MSEVQLTRFANVLAIVILNIEQFCQRNYKTIKKYFLKEKKIRASSGIYWKAFDEWDFLELV